MTSLFEQYDLILQSGLFDQAFYLSQNPEVTELGLDPVLHFLESGAANGREPSPVFDSPFYRRQANKFGLEPENALVHFILEGRALGLQCKKGAAAKLAPDSGRSRQFKTVLAAGLVDRAFYNAQCKAQFPSDAAALEHFDAVGDARGRRLNLYFDPAWYRLLVPGVNATGLQLLIHYLSIGESQGLAPSRLFDPAWYRAQYSLADDANALIHYLQNRRTGRFSPLAEFDVRFYTDTNHDVRDAGIDPFEHFILLGYREGRNPSPNFSLPYYINRHLHGTTTVNPFIHYLEHRHQPGVHAAPPPEEGNVHRTVRNFTRPSPAFEEFRKLPETAPRNVKILAYYLPQFHPFPENDQWWGMGFTEWTNIARGVPRFEGHYQPRIPRDLGFYSLLDPETLKRQVALAKGGGVHGFVYYYYWFNGKRLMASPLEQLLSDSSIDMPFCLMWANENWTRRWDGDDQEVLISQDYDPADDEMLVADFARHFRDSRYIRVQGRPVLMIYRAGAIPNVNVRLGQWRQLFKRLFKEDPLLVMAQSFDHNDPREFGFDGAIEFPPHKLTSNLPWITAKVKHLDYDLTARVFEYDAVAARSLNESAPDYPLIKTVVPSWDNDARRQGAGLVITGSSPNKYEAWLRSVVQAAKHRPFFGESFVGVNAWNEWCESAYLEPDIHYGSAYLNATGRAVTGFSEAPGEYKLLLIGHDAFPSGSQHLLLHLAKRLQADHGVQLEVLLLGGGKLEASYRELAPLSIVGAGDELLAKLDHYRARGYRNALVNTVAAAHILPLLRQRDIEALTLIHELPGIIRDKSLVAGARAALELSRAIVFASPVIGERVSKFLQLPLDERMHYMPQGLYRSGKASAKAADGVRKSLGLKHRDKLVVGVGYADRRKGFDLFLQLWRQARESRHRIHFCWIGGMDPELRLAMAKQIALAEKSGRFHLPGYRDDVPHFLSAADAFVLTSREDPFPTVVHEALAAGLPVIAFDGSGGMPDFLRQHHMGVVVPMGRVAQMSAAILTVLMKPITPGDRQARQRLVKEKLDFGRYANEIMHLSVPNLGSVSVAVPSYNYAQFLPARLGSIFRQTHPIEELLVLDDASTDGSGRVARSVAEDWHRKLRLIANKRNSGSVFTQWRKAAEQASGEFLWIAEADDLSDPRFLEALLPVMQSGPDIAFGFTDSQAIHYDGSPQWASYKSYYSQQEQGALAESMQMDGIEFVRRFLAVRNLVLNVSAVIWRRSALLKALDEVEPELADYRMAGDWRVYLQVLSAPEAKIAYIADALNIHRRHSSSVTSSLNSKRHLDEIKACHKVANQLLGESAARQKQQARYVLEVAKQLGPR